jgi:hypothetical protein
MTYTPRKSLIQHKEKYYQINVPLTEYYKKSNPQSIVIEEVFNRECPTIMIFETHNEWSYFIDNCNVMYMNGKEIEVYHKK